MPWIKNGDNGPMTCKFCGKPVWLEEAERRVYEPGGEELHVNNCPLRKAHYHRLAIERAQARRERKFQQLR